MSLSKKVFQPKIMQNTMRSWFHAAAVSKHFQLTREMK
jgi:hypothetical protein